MSGIIQYHPSLFICTGCVQTLVMWFDGGWKGWNGWLIRTIYGIASILSFMWGTQETSEWMNILIFTPLDVIVVANYPPNISGFCLTDSTIPVIFIFIEYMPCPGRQIAMGRAAPFTSNTVQYTKSRGFYNVIFTWLQDNNSHSELRFLCWLAAI